MSESIRAEVVSLLTDLDISADAGYTEWFRHGRYVTDEEAELIGSATPEELDAYRDRLWQAIQDHKEALAEQDRIDAMYAD